MPEMRLSASETGGRARPARWSGLTQQVARAVEMAAAGPSVELFERLCSLEQTLADTCATVDEDGVRDGWRDGVERLRAAAVDTAAALWMHGRLAVTWPGDLVRHLEVLPSSDEIDDAWEAVAPSSSRLPMFDYLCMWPVWPECTSSEPVDLERYARIVRYRAGDRTDLDLVVGIRSSGSYLGAIWAAAIRSAGGSPRFTTVRPQHRTLVNLWGRTSSRTEGEAAGSGTRAIVVDDLLGTGVSVRLTTDLLGEAGVAPEDRFVSLYRPGASVREAATRCGVERSRLLAIDGAQAAWPQALDAPPELDVVADHLRAAVGDQGFELVEVERLAPARLLRLLAGMTGLSPDEASVGLHGIARNRRYLLTVRGADGVTDRWVAKPLGFGHRAAEERRRLGALPHHVPVRTVAGGYLLYDWVDADPLPFRDRRAWAPSPSDLRVLGEVAASVAAAAPARTCYPAERAALRVEATLAELDRRGVGGLPDAAAIVDAIREPWIPVVPAAPNGGHWHNLRRRDGHGLVKVHRDIPNLNRRCDPLEDMASAAVELDLTPEEVLRVRDAYIASARDPASIGRLALAMLQYVARVLREPDLYHRRAEERLGPARVRTPDGLLHRYEGVRDSVGLAGLLLEAR